MQLRGLYAILDLPDRHGLAPGALLEAVARGGARWVQLRAKKSSRAQRLALALEMGPLAHAWGLELIVDDDLELALAGVTGVTGLHLGQADLASLARRGLSGSRVREQLAERGLRLGVSTHDLDQVRDAVDLGADYIGVGPVFPTTSKKDPDPVVGLEGVERASQLCDLPVVAIGGIDPGRAELCARAGARAVAVISGLQAPSLEVVEERATEFTRRFS